MKLAINNLHETLWSSGIFDIIPKMNQLNQNQYGGNVPEPNQEGKQVMAEIARLLALLKQGNL